MNSKNFSSVSPPPVSLFHCSLNIDLDAPSDSRFFSLSSHAGCCHVSAGQDAHSPCESTGIVSEAVTLRCVPCSVSGFTIIMFTHVCSSHFTTDERSSHCQRCALTGERRRAQSAGRGRCCCFQSGNTYARRAGSNRGTRDSTISCFCFYRCVFLRLHESPISFASLSPRASL